MTAQIIPTGADPFSRQTTTLDGVPYTLDFLFSQRESCWYLLLSTVDGNPIAGACSLVVNWSIFGWCKDTRAPPGRFIVISSTADLSPPGLTDLAPGGRCTLVYVPAADVATVLAKTPVAPVFLLAPSLTLAQGGAAPLTLDGLQWLMPSQSVRSSGVNGPITYNVASRTATVTTTLGGDPSLVYNVLLRLRGFVEQKTYTGGASVLATGTNARFFVAGATAAADNSDVFSLQVSSPAQTYYLNSGTSSAGVGGVATVFPIDYTAVVAMQGGATVTLLVDTIDSIEVANQTDGLGGSPVSVSGISSPAQPYVGQFVQLNVARIF